ncbi:MAG: cytochrome P450 [Myxococcales bacterium]|nr:cytochrome P450 [Myxococcales bacterium]
MLPPGPGKLFSISAARRLLRDPPGLITDFTARYGPVWRTHLPDRGRLKDLVWLMGPEGNERILAATHKDDFSWHEGYRFTMEPIFGATTLILLDGAAHRTRQRALQPAFHARMDGDHGAAMREIAEGRFAGWRRGETIDLAGELKRISFHVVARQFLGAADAEIPPLTRLFEEIGLGLFSVFKVPLPGTRFHRGVKARRALAGLLAERIRDYRRSGAIPANMLGSLMRSEDDAGEPLPDETLVSEMLALVFAGYDTTSSLLTSLWVELGRRPEIHAALQGEARALGEATPQASSEQPLLDAALQEAERLHPPLVFCLRGATRDLTFRGFEIPAGSKVAYSAHYTGRMPELFERPLEFRPERFLDGWRPPAYAMVGFGGGPRACIGKRFAQIEMRLITTLILQRWDFEFLPGQSDEMYYNPTPQRRHGFQVRIR